MASAGIGTIIGALTLKLPILFAIGFGIGTGVTVSLTSAGIATAALASLSAIGINKVPRDQGSAKMDNDLSPSTDEIPQKLAVTNKKRLASSIGIGATAIFAYNAAFNSDDIDAQTPPVQNAPIQIQEGSERASQLNNLQNDQGEYILTAKAPAPKLGA
tara:strand:+ start:534788 stop:535264 length:477 start_codon:yes stop_codon:yes gene_type:complete